MISLSMDQMRAARERIAPYVKPSPLIESASLSALIGRPTQLKLELLQPSGSFKTRGAHSKLLSLDESDRRQGCVAVSGGNHGLAVASAARALGIDMQIFLPRTAPKRSVERMRADKADLVVCDTVAEAFAGARGQAERGKAFVHPFDDLEVLAGQSTIGLELVEADNTPTDLIISVGGGGLLTGIASAVKAYRPETRIWAVETVGAESMTQALKAGHPVDVQVSSIATTLGAPSVSETTLAAAKAHVEDLVLVPDAEAVRDMMILLDETSLLCEPATSCTLSAARLITERLPADARIGLVLCGGNVTLEELADWRVRFGL